jgi:glutaryl-CoA dehydrogenase
LRPVARANWESATFPRELVRPFAALGVLGGMVGGYDCPDIGPLAFGLAMQELARVDSSFATFAGIDGGLVPSTLQAFGTEEQKQRWLPRLANGDAIGAFGLTEPDHGSDAAGMETSAVRDGDDYMLNGAKRWIGNATICDVVVIWARAEEGIAGFLVEPPNPGFNATLIEGKLSQRAVWQAQITLENCRVPAANRLMSDGFGAVVEALHKSRHYIAWHALGEAIACYEIALAYAKERQQFGKPIAAFQLVQAKLVRMLGEITKTQLLLIQLGRLLACGGATTGMTALGKLTATRTAREVAATAREILGGNGILHDYEVMRHLCDIEAVYTFEGTFDVNTLVVGREITGLRAFV